GERKKSAASGATCKGAGSRLTYRPLGDRSRRACPEKGLVPGTYESPIPANVVERSSLMARVTVEDCLEREENRFALVVLASERTRQIMKGSHPLVRAKNRPAVLSLREIAAGKVHFNRPSHEVVEEWIDAALKRQP